MSPYIPPTNRKCLTFYYSMNGKRIGKLNVWLRPLRSKGWLIFSERGNKGSKPEWRNGYGNVMSSVPFKVMSAQFQDKQCLMFVEFDTKQTILLPIV